MRIYHVIATGSGWGGLERCVTDLANFQSASHTVAVGGAAGVLARLEPSVQRHPLPMHQSRRDPRLLWSLRRSLLDFKPDVIHAQAGKAAALVNSLRLFLPRIPRVATIHGIKRHLGFLRHFDRVIAVSRRAGLSLGDVPHSVVWNGIPPVVPPPRPADLSVFPFLGQGRPVIAMVGRLVEEKGVDVLLQAMRNVDACVWIIGDGPLRPELESMSRNLGLAGRVWFAGFRTDVSTLVCLADLMVVSSRREGFPIAFMEMLHLRRPVVGTRVGGVEDVLPPEWTCEPGDADGLADLLRKAAGELPALSGRFAPVFDLASRELRLGVAAGKIEAVYHEAVSSAARRRV